MRINPTATLRYSTIEQDKLVTTAILDINNDYTLVTYIHNYDNDGASALSKIMDTLNQMPDDKANRFHFFILERTPSEDEYTEIFQYHATIRTISKLETVIQTLIPNVTSANNPVNCFGYIEDYGFEHVQTFKQYYRVCLLLEYTGKRKSIKNERAFHNCICSIRNGAIFKQ